MSDFETKFLVNFVQGLETDPFCQMGVFFSPIFKNKLEVGAYSCSFILQFFNISLVIEEELDGISGHHEVKDEIPVLRLVTCYTNHISDLFRILSDQLVLGVPVRFLHHIGEEDSLNFVKQKYFSDGFKNFVNWVLEGNVTTTGNRT